MPADATEIEVKFDVTDAEDLARLPSLIGLAGGRIVHSAVHVFADRYLDTDDCWLARAGLGLRVRSQGQRRQLTLKVRGHPASTLLERREIQEPLTRLPPRRPAPVPGRRIAARLREARPDLRVAPVVELRQRRTVFEVELKRRARVLVTADRTRVADRNRSAPGFHEVEIERVSGPVSRMERFARRMARLAGWPARTDSKLERALLLTGRLPPPAESLPLPAGALLSDAASCVWRRNLERWRANEPGVFAGFDPEYVHDMRVAVRRLRASLTVFSEALPAAEAAPLRIELRWLAGVLGRTRDLDIVRHLLDTSSAGGIAPAAFAALGAALDRLRRRAAGRIRGAIRSPRYRAALELMAALAAGWDRPATEAAARPASEVLWPKLRRRFRKTLRAGRRTQKRESAEALHALRIRFKKLRYACEFASDLCASGLRDSARRAADLQRLLGEHQDEQVFLGWLDRMRAKRPDGVAAEDWYMLLDRLEEEHRRRREKLRRRFWKRLARLRFSPGFD